MTCPNCGSAVSKDWQFCPKCNTSLAEPPQPLIPTAPPQAPSAGSSIDPIDVSQDPAPSREPVDAQEDQTPPDPGPIALPRVPPPPFAGATGFPPSSASRVIYDSAGNPQYLPPPAPPRPKVPFQRTLWFNLLCLLLCCPLGLVVMWIYAPWKPAVKATVTVLFLLMCWFVHYCSTLPTPAPSATKATAHAAPPQPVAKPPATKPPAAAPPTPAATDASAPDASATNDSAPDERPDDVVKFPALGQFPNLATLLDNKTYGPPSRPWIVNFTYAAPKPNDADSGQCRIEVNAVSDETTQLRSGSIQMEIADIFIAANQDKMPAASIDVQADDDLTDKYGNDTRGVVYEAKLDRQSLAKVNWADDKKDLEFNVLPGLWNETFNLDNVVQGQASPDDIKSLEQEKSSVGRALHKFENSSLGRTRIRIVPVFRL